MALPIMLSTPKGPYQSTSQVYASAICLLITIMKVIRCIVHIKSSLYYRYNLSRTHFARLIRNLYIVHFHSTILDVYYLHLWKQYDVFVHIKSSLYYRYNLSRTQLWDWWGIFTLFTFTLQYWMSITYTYERNTMYLCT